MTIFKSFRKGFKKTVPKIRKGVRTAAKTYLNVMRSGAVKNYRKTGKWSSTAIAKSLSNLHARVNTIAEYKTLDENHVTASPDVSTRQFYNISASALQSTVSTTTTPGTTGYFLQQITLPTRGDGLTNYDGKRYKVTSIQWKGSIYIPSTSNDTNVRMYIIRYDDEDMDGFQMNEFLKTDFNGEYSLASKRNPDYKGYKVIASRVIRVGGGTSRRKDFNILCRPPGISKIFEADDTIYPRFYCLIVGSSDISTVNVVNYVGNTRMRFIA